MTALSIPALHPRTSTVLSRHVLDALIGKLGEGPGILDRYLIQIVPGDAHPQMIMWRCLPCHHVGLIARDLNGDQTRLTLGEILAAVIDHEEDDHPDTGNTPTWITDAAMDLATRFHRGALDKAGRPYLDHVEDVAVALNPCGPVAVAAGWLHDIVEDTPLTLDDLRLLGFPDMVVDAVDSVTIRSGEPYRTMVLRAAAHPVGLLVKLADNVSNSDPARLALLDEGTRDRLTVKYRHARNLLWEALPVEHREWFADLAESKGINGYR